MFSDRYYNECAPGNIHTQGLQPALAVVTFRGYAPFSLVSEAMHACFNHFRQWRWNCEGRLFLSPSTGPFRWGVLEGSLLQTVVDSSPDLQTFDNSFPFEDVFGCVTGKSHSAFCIWGEQFKLRGFKLRDPLLEHPWIGPLRNISETLLSLLCWSSGQPPSVGSERKPNN